MEFCPRLPLSRWRLITLAAAVTMSASSGASRAGSQADLKSRFVEQAPAAWEQYEAHASRFQGTAKATRSADGKPYTCSDYLFKSNDHCRLVLMQSCDARATGGRLEAFNPVYSFRLLRRQADAPWVLQELELGNKPGVRDRWDSKKDILGALFVCVRLAEEHLVDLVRKPTFRVTQATAVPSGHTNLAKIEFDNAHPLNTRTAPFDPIQGGSLLLDPERFWTLRGFVLRYKTPQGDSTVTAEYEIRDLTAEIPIPKRYADVLDMSQLKEGKAIVRNVINYDLVQGSNDVGDHEFTMSAFGLPEPRGVVWQQSSHWYLWFIGAAGLCLAAGGLLWHRGRRRRLAATTVPTER